MVLTKERIEKWYKAGSWEKDWVADAVATGTITPEEYLAITGEEYTDSSLPPKPVKNLVAEKLSAADATFTGDVKIKGGKPVLTVAQSLTEAEKAQARANIGVSAGVSKVYGFHVNGKESNPDLMITYLADAVGLTPCHMDYEQDRFDWGSWKDAFFIPKPCMLKFDGKVAYYLDPNDYTKKADGTPSDVADTSFEGNAMMEFPRIWWKVVPDANDTSSASVYIASYQADSDFHAWSNINSKNELIDHFYTPIYNGSLDEGGKLRSISGQAIINTKNAQAEIDAAKKNNPVDSEIQWWTETYADNMLLQFLGMLIGRCTDTQKTFGAGYIEGGGSADKLVTTGGLEKKGLFWGTKANDKLGVKFFGMEHFWGHQWRRYAGHVLVDGVEKVKLTYGTADGGGTGYNTTGANYLATPRPKHTGTSGNYIKTMYFSKYGMGPLSVDGGSATTYYSDACWFNDAYNNPYASRGGLCDSGLVCGLFSLALNAAPSNAHWAVGASVSCKPL